MIKSTQKGVMRMDRKILFFDFDGTITSDRTGTIPQSAVDIIEELRKCGHRLILNTGRTKGILDPVTNMMNFDGRILACGGYVEYQDEVLYESCVEEEFHQELLEKLEEFEIETFLEGTDHLYISDDIHSERLCCHVQRYRDKGVSIRSIHDEALKFQKMFVYMKNMEKAKAFKEYMSQHFEYIDRGGQCVELVIKGHSKATGIRKLLENQLWDLEDCYVFGDSNNDLPMFQYVPKSVLIGGENPELRKQVYYVGESVEQDGLAKAIHALGLV